MATIDKKKGTGEGTMDLLVWMTSLCSGGEVKTKYLMTVRHYRHEDGILRIYRLTTVGYNPVN